MTQNRTSSVQMTTSSPLSPTKNRPVPTCCPSWLFGRELLLLFEALRLQLLAEGLDLAVRHIGRRPRGQNVQCLHTVGRGVEHLSGIDGPVGYDLGHGLDLLQPEVADLPLDQAVQGTLVGVRSRRRARLGRRARFGRRLGGRFRVGIRLRLGVPRPGGEENDQGANDQHRQYPQDPRYGASAQEKASVRSATARRGGGWCRRRRGRRLPVLAGRGRLRGCRGGAGRGRRLLRWVGLLGEVLSAGGAEGGSLRYVCAAVGTNPVHLTRSLLPS